MTSGIEFIKGTTIEKKHTASGYYYERKKLETYINPNAIETAVYDPVKHMTGITVKGNLIMLDGNVMKDYEQRQRGSVEHGTDNED